jgi:hypothetical protein
MTSTERCQRDSREVKLVRPEVEVAKVDSKFTKQINACCTSPAAMCYWLTVSLIGWGILNVLGNYWRPVHASSGVTCLIAMAIGCFANWRRNRSFHCAITGPLFVLAGLVLLLSELRMVRVTTALVWPLVFIGTGIAFLLERRHAKRLGYHAKEIRGF